ncbi:hypothetical protein [Bradyrhizobium sp. Ec3.3]|uniref:hypothetical protein n=1 Tax=Bradyrhizobium sp. Ec3.3 TaxID=189753 RepID=UPI0004080212|nr:hypothetical protein [Bradyrhizobium sp. Ec3.3]
MRIINDKFIPPKTGSGVKAAGQSRREAGAARTRRILENQIVIMRALYYFAPENSELRVEMREEIRSALEASRALAAEDRRQGS